MAIQYVQLQNGNAQLIYPGQVIPTGATVIDETTFISLVHSIPTVYDLLGDSAATALALSDRVVIRCSEHGVTVPAEWVAYRVALRNILNGTDTTSIELPVQPDYPQGT